MKLSELLAEHPHLDAELDMSGEEMVLDGIYIFRCIKPADPQGMGRLLHAAPEGTDGIVVRGLVTALDQILASEWPVHVCGDDHDQ